MCEIEMFMHCRKCLEELPDGESPASYARLAVGLTAEKKIQVWCNRHDAEVGTLDAETIAYMETCECAACKAKREEPDVARS